jgi:hypothetical protein
MRRREESREDRREMERRDMRQMRDRDDDGRRRDDRPNVRRPDRDEEWSGPQVALDSIEFSLHQIKGALFPYRPAIISHGVEEALEQVELLEQWLHSRPPGGLEDEREFADARGGR